MWYQHAYLTCLLYLIPPLNAYRCSSDSDCRYCGNAYGAWIQCWWGSCIRSYQGQYPQCEDPCYAEPGYYCNRLSLTICPPGYFCESRGMTAPTLCPAGFMCPVSGSTAPVPCTPGMLCQTAGVATPTVSCSIGYYCAESTSIQCPPNTQCLLPGLGCPTDRKCVGILIACPEPGTHLPTGFVGYPCPPCPAGSMCAPDSVAIPCPAGTYSPYGATQCTPCRSGTYSSSAGSPVCTMCPLGFTTSPMGATSLAQCACRPGYSRI